ncbi:hypothetical protein Poly51_47740 [Rubripirellula tenax]|uniref:Uncharacterized protein n=1 Tax=Rubripirellula tenax TaxID=2528015 RepID=A0A5C6EK40_9BACT|nr:hypothetical protein Poly51_47740 [Rubripirellula tenax]
MCQTLPGSDFCGPNSLLKKGSDPLETLLKHREFETSERVSPLFQQAAKLCWPTFVWPAIAGLGHPRILSINPGKPKDGTTARRG